MELVVGEEGYAHALFLGGSLQYVAVTTMVVGAVLLNGPAVGTFHATGVLLVLAAVFVLATAMIPMYRRRPKTFEDFLMVCGLLGCLVGPVLLWLMGPLHGEAMCFLPGYAGASFFWSRRTGALLTGLGLAGEAVVVLTVHGFVDPIIRIGVAAAWTVPLAVIMAWASDRLRELAARERAATAEVTALAGELAELNGQLEVRVAEQVEQIDALGRLERFLSPQVAQAVMSSTDAALLQPHRRQIAVLFCDLRGFTAFTGSADPEEVVDVLGGYYDAAGELIQQHDATLGSFEGDGIMCYFNDPFPCDDPPWEAVQMAQELRHSLRALQLRWQAKGFHLGFGIGIAWGYATLGTFGFKGRSDYTALGTVVNLASRLCAQAADGQILLDPRAHDAAGDRISATAVDVDLKGFRGPVHA
jgi:class 3 adenylate cyclase